MSEPNVECEGSGRTGEGPVASIGSPGWAGAFDASAAFSPEPDALAAFLAQVPARWVVYLMTDGEDRPVQLLCVKNLRASLKRRLGGPELLESGAKVAPSKRVDYRGLVRRVYWRRVDSRFEADAVYLEAARAVFPESYRGMVGFRPTWFLHVDPDAPFPRYVKTTDLSAASGVLIGPVEDKHAAGRLIELVESAFDLCRYHNILTESPHGKACAYKEMGRCPAPCDGSVGLEQYRRMVELSTRVLVDPGDMVREHEIRMRQAAAELKFEAAGKIKQYVEELSAFGKGAYRHARKLEDFQYVALQPGPKPGTAKLFLVTPGRITEEAGLMAEPSHAGPVLRLLLERAEARRARSTDAEGAERVAVVAWHLFSPKNTSGVFVPLAELEERSLLRAYKELNKQKRQDTEEAEGDEGLTRELQSMGGAGVEG